MQESAIFVKTDKGYEEVEKRSFGIDNHLRMVLIMIDGKVSVAELLSRLKAFGNVYDILTWLTDEGFIVSKTVNQGNNVFVTKLSTVALPSKSASASNDDVINLNQAKRQIKRLLERYFGPMVSPMIGRLNACEDRTQLIDFLKYSRNLITESINQQRAEQFWADAIAENILLR